jgi:hypothetical protein
MNTVVLRVETELDPSAAPRVFGYLGGLGHIPMRAALVRDGGTAMVMEVHFESPLPAAQLISAKVEQMPFVLRSSLGGQAPRDDGSAGDGTAPTGHPINVSKGGMQHAPHCDVSALRFAAAQRGQAIHHRSRVQFNA